LHKDGRYYALADLQVRVEEDDRLSVYLKPPMGLFYRPKKINDKLNVPHFGVQAVDLGILSQKGYCFNPYVTWHGSGRTHVNAYNAKDLSLEATLGDIPSPSIFSIRRYPDSVYQVITGMYPLNDRSHARVAPPSPQRRFEISWGSKNRNNDIDGSSPAYFVIEEDSLKPECGYLIMDILVHGRGNELSPAGNHPYPGGVPLSAIAPPMKITPKDTRCPAVTVFFYQPIDDEPLADRKLLTTLFAGSNTTSDALIIQYEMVAKPR
jgi:hypothetical protein